MKLCLALLFALTVPTFQKPQFLPPFDYDANVGVAVENARGICLDIENAELLPGERIQFVNPLSQPQTTGEFEITGKREEGCTVYAQDRSGLSHYQLKLIRGSLDMSAPLFALAKFHGSISRTDFGASADLDGDGTHEYFRSCASSEGLHLTVWSGKPLEGRRRWHGYHYLGYDVEPNCSEGETMAIQNSQREWSPLAREAHHIILPRNQPEA